MLQLHLPSTKFLVDDTRSAILRSDLIDVLVEMLQRNEIEPTTAAINVLEILVQYGVSFFSPGSLLLTAPIENTRIVVLRSSVIPLLVKMLYNDDLGKVAADILMEFAGYRV